MTIKGLPDKTQGELIRLLDYGSSKGILVPRELLIYDINGTKREPQVKVAISRFELNARLTRSDFLRPR